MPREQLLFRHGEERTTQCGEDAERIVGPLDRSQRGPQSVHLLALVERLAADDEMRQAARLELADVFAGHVVRELHQAAEQQADVASANRAAARRAGDWRRTGCRHVPFPRPRVQSPALIGHGVAALAHQPAHEFSDRLRQRAFDRTVGDASVVAQRTRHRQRHHRWLRGVVVARRLQLDVLRLQRLASAGHVHGEGGVHQPLNAGHAAERRAQSHPRRALLLERFADGAIDADVGAAEAIDRLLRVADDEECPRTHGEVEIRHLGAGLAVGRQAHEQLGLQRIGVLELVDQQVAEASLEVMAHVGVIADEIAGANQQVEEVEGTGAGLPLLVEPHGVAERLVHQRGQVGVGGVAELDQRVDQGVAGGDHRGVRDLPGELPAGAPAVPQVAFVVGQRAEQCFPAVVVAQSPLAQRPDLVPGAAQRLDRPWQRIPRVDRPRRGVAQRADAIEQVVDVGIAGEVGGAGPGRGMVAPLQQVAPGPLQALDRRIVVLVLAEPPRRPPPQRPPHAFARRVEFTLQPVGERLVVQARALIVGEHREGGIDPGLYRPLAQQVGAEAVNRADVRFLEALHRRRQARRGNTGGSRARVLELLAQPQLELAGRLLGERDGDDLIDPGPAGLDQPHDALHEFGGLAGAGGGLDDQRAVQRVADEGAVAGVGVGAHGILRRTSRSGTSGLRRVRANSSGPHTARKSQ